MGLFSFITGAIKPITGLIDELTTTDEEKMKLNNELTKLQNEMSSKLLDYEAKLMESQSKIITAEATGESWLQRNWRPLCMVCFLVLIICHYLGLLAFPIADQMWTLLQIGIGGYIGGRTVEKVLPKIVEVIKK